MTMDEVTVMMEIEMGRDDDNDYEKRKAKRSANARQNRTQGGSKASDVLLFQCLL